MRTINPNLYPHGGHFFKEADGTRIVGDSWGGVIARVKRYRERQGRPVGDVAGEVMQQACANNPDLCFEDNGVNQAQLMVTNLKSRVLAWLTKKRTAAQAGEIRFVEKSLQMARTDVCIRCANNQAQKTGCGSCKQAVQALRESVIGARDFDHRIHDCVMTGEHLPVATWIDDVSIPDPALPWECWRKRNPL